MSETVRDETIRVENKGPVTVITIHRPQARNAVDRATAAALTAAFRTFEQTSSQSVAILTGSGEHFCAGADLKAVAQGEPNRIELTGDGPMGPTRLLLNKPVIAAIEGYCVAGGLELAIWCDLRVAAATATFGMFCRRFGVPLIDGGTVRLPRLIGHSRAMDMILTGRSVDADEAAAIGLVNRLCATGEALSEAVALANDLAAFPQLCLRSDRKSSYDQWDLDTAAALHRETERGLEVLASGETATGARAFESGVGRHGRFSK